MTSRVRSVGFPTHLIVAAAVAAPFLVSAAERPRICIAGVRNDSGNGVRRDLSRALCERYECVPAAAIRRGGRLDFDLVKAKRVRAVLFGTVAARGRRLELAMLVTELTPTRTWALPLDSGGHLARRDLDALARDLDRELKPRPSGPAPPAVAPSPSTPRSPVASAPPAAPLPGAPPAVTRPDRSRGPPSAAPAAARAERVAIEAGVDVARRELTPDPGAALRKYTASGIFSPSLTLELHPLALLSEAPRANVVVFAAYARSVRLRTRDAALPDVWHDTAYSRFEAGLGWGFGPFSSREITIVPRVSYRTLSFVIEPAGGSTIPGVPDAHLAGPRFGADLELRIWGPVRLVTAAGFTVWTKAKDLIGGGFYPEGSANAFDGTLGLAWEVAWPVSLRAAVHYERTRYTLEGPSASGAEAATDAYVSGRASVIARF